MSNLTKLLSLIVFIVLIWSVNSFLLPRVTSDLEVLKESKRDLYIKQSFNDNSPSILAKSINEFVLKEFDKNEAINLIDNFSKDSGVLISSLDIQAENKESSIPVIEDNTINDMSISSDEESSINIVQSNTLKSVNLNLTIKGSKNSIDSFISKLSNSNQYIDIQDISINFNNSDEGTSTEIDAQITAILYYIKL